MLGRVGKSKDYRAFIDPRHTFDNFLCEGAADCAHADDGGRLDAFDSSDEIPRRHVLVSVRNLEIDEVLPCRLQQAVDVEHIDP